MPLVRYVIMAAVAMIAGAKIKEFYLSVPLKMLSPKRPVPDFCDIEPTKKFKTDSSKENIPPNTSEICEKNCNSRYYEQHVKGTPKKHVEKDDPVTPNTNFKMLTSIAAGLDYANCSSPKSRNSSENAILIDNVESVDSSVCRVNRKEKSLAIICSRFLLIYPLYPERNSNIIVSLDDACLKLGVERRRLYDIVNVFESIDMLKKLAKNKYLWFGKVNLSSALCCIKKAAEKENILAKLQYVFDHEESGTELKQSCILDEVQEFTQTFEVEASNSSTLRSLLQHSPLPELRKEKSLAIMSQKFLMLFLVSPSKIISLGVAAKVLNGFQKTERSAQIKTQIRRLYDIANVLSSIGLIQKEITISQIGRKPAFKYIGPSPEEFETLSDKPQNFFMNNSKQVNNNENSRILSRRHASFQEICAVAEMEHKRICLEETANSAPPFEKSILKSDKTLSKTTFSNLNLNNTCDTENIKPGNFNINITSNPKIDTKSSTAFQNILPKLSSEDSKKMVVQPKPLSLQVQGNLKVINVSKEIFSANGAYYILNSTSNNGTKSPTPIGTLLFISPLPVSKSTEITDAISSQNKVFVPSKNLSKVQQDRILHVISSNQENKQEDGIPRSKSPRRNLTQLIQEMQAAENVRLQTESIVVNQFKSISKDISLNDGDSNESSGVYGTRNNSSSSSRFNSPLSIPSGYATPVPSTSSDFSFLSNSETHSILKNIESQPNCDQRSENSIKKDIPGQNNVSKNITENDKPNVEVINTVKLSSSQPNIQKLSVFSNNNGSNDSINSEVAEILKGKRLGDDPVKLKPFLIDEKTILSPIKNKGEIVNRTLTPSPFITPPYAPSDTIFEFKNVELKKCH
ncbi:Transcription factor E2F7 [Araneus ventricosus]|uniref:Transcription factor E2F7 n=1 Tax=Araneus ventricosus TaxID=182803 RepID=A0A4Y2BS27_ARAVE|nr:Transcription factor E2F7 [Araneus ventricosus]